MAKKATKMVDPNKTNDEAPTGDAGAGAPGAPSETAELQSIEPSTEEQSGPVPALEAAELFYGNEGTLQLAEPPAGEQSQPPAVPEPKAAEPRSAESPAGAQSGPAKVRYRVLATVFVNGSVVDPKGRKDVYVFAAPGLEGTALKLAPEGEAGTATAG